MFMLAESGSSKTDWLLFTENSIERSFRTSGINPDVQAETIFAATLREEWLPQLGADAPAKLFFYGAGLRNPENRKTLAATFHRLMPGLEAHIEHDLLGSARAICGDEAGIACILGTGSNSCRFDGRTVTGEKGGNGYLFGDEGSGADLGKALIKAALDEELDSAIVQGMEEWAGMNLLDIRREVHLAPRINVALARWSQFIIGVKDHPQVRSIILSRFSAFLEKTVMRYEAYQQMNTGFVGSIAFYYESLLREACRLKSIPCGKIIERPAEALVEYHLKHG